MTLHRTSVMVPVHLARASLVDAVCLSRPSGFSSSRICTLYKYVIGSSVVLTSLAEIFRSPWIWCGRGWSFEGGDEDVEAVGTASVDSPLTFTFDRGRNTSTTRATNLETGYVSEDRDAG